MRLLPPVVLLGFYEQCEDDYQESVIGVKVSSYMFYKFVWEKAISDIGIQYVKRHSVFNKEKFDTVFIELDRLDQWAKKNLKGKKLKEMQDGIQGIRDSVNEALKCENIEFTM